MELICQSTVLGDPVSKVRPRFNAKTGHAYHDPAAVAAEQAIAWQAKADNPGLEPVAGDLSVTARFYCAHRKSPALYKDADNMLKAVLDAYNGVVWIDDHQVLEINATVVRGDPEPRSVIEVYRLAAGRSAGEGTSDA